jgi:hypothetical protein
MKKAKKEPTYKIEFSGQRVLDDYRGDRIYGDVYIVSKFTDDKNDANYEVTISTLGETCTCPGRSHSMCKHRQMVEIFRAMKHKPMLVEDKDEN